MNGFNLRSKKELNQTIILLKEFENLKMKILIVGGQFGWIKLKGELRKKPKRDKELCKTIKSLQISQLENLR